MITREVESRFYIPEIDGLRALAVLAVMVYHLVPHTLPGGFSGVDVFFVISGFVVTGSMSRDAALPVGRFILAFYARRFRRIVPALVVCLCVTVLLSVALIPESWLSDTLRVTGLSAFFGLSNFTLATVSDGYFATRTEFNPFTHTWSLAVEEQFYVLFPLLAYLIIAQRVTRVNPATGRMLLISLTVGSLLWCAVATSTNHDSAYFLLPSRFWELGVGAMLFLVGHDKRASLVSRLGPLRCAGAGLVLIVGGFLLANPEAFPFPWAVIPVTGTALVILAATSRAPDSSTWVLRALGSRQLVHVGLLSYSLYLWHWPVYTLLRWTVGLESVLMYALALAATWVLASASYHLIERPSQRHDIVRRLPHFATVLAGVTSIVGGWGAANLVHAQAWRIRQTVVAKGEVDWSPYSRRVEQDVDALCQSTSAKLPLDGMALLPTDCKGGQPARLPTLFVAGDSHAGAYTRMLEGLVHRTGISVHLFSMGGCAVGGTLRPLSSADETCQDFHAGVLSYLRDNSRPGDILFLPSLRIERIVEQDGRVTAQPGSVEAQKDHAKAESEMFELTNTLTRAGLKVIVDLPKPVFRAPPFRCADKFNHMNPVCEPGFSMDRAFMEQYRADAVSMIRRVAGRVENVYLWDPLPELCSALKCDAFDGKRPLFFDADHLSGYGNERLLPSFEALVTKLVKNRGS